MSFKYADHFFDTFKVTTTAFPTVPSIDWNFQSVGLTLVNISSQRIEYSFNGRRLDGVLDCIQPSISLDNKSVSRIYFRSPDGNNPEVRISAWPKVSA